MWNWFDFIDACNFPKYLMKLMRMNFLLSSHAYNIEYTKIPQLMTFSQNYIGSNVKVHSDKLRFGAEIAMK